MIRQAAPASIYLLQLLLPGADLELQLIVEDKAAMQNQRAANYQRQPCCCHLELARPSLQLSARRLLTPIGGQWLTPDSNSLATWHLAY